MSLLGAYKRLRRSYGFGIHSPWAYHIVREVLPDEYAYYDYATIRRLYGADGRMACMLYRVLADAAADTVSVQKNSHWQKLVKMAGRGHRNIRVSVQHDSDRLDADIVIFTALDTADGRAAWRRCLQQLDRRHSGIAIDTCRRLGIINASAGMPRQNIEIRTLRNTQ